MGLAQLAQEAKHDTGQLHIHTPCGKVKHLSPAPSSNTHIPQKALIH